MNLSLKKALTVPIILVCISGKAQDSTVVSDFESWNSISLRSSFLDNKLKLTLTQEFRLNDNSSNLGQMFTELKASYEVINDLELGFGYRWIKDDEKYGEKQWRYNIDLGYSHKLDRFELGYRIRYQHHDYFENSAGDGDYATNKYRFRLKAEYNISNWKLDPYFSTELFYASTTADAVQYLSEVETGTVELNGMEKIRFTLGTSFCPFNNAKLGVFYRIEKSIKSFPTYLGTTTFNPATIYIVGISFRYNLNFDKDE